MPLRLMVAVLVACGVAAPAASVAAKPRPRAHLSAFRSCGELVRYARRHVPVSRPMSLVGAPKRGTPENTTEQTPAAGGGEVRDFSGTNVVEAGVDEPDIVKTDGRSMFAIANGRLVSVDVRNDPAKLLGSLPLDGSGHQLLIDGNRALVISSSGNGGNGGDVGDVKPASVPYGGAGESLVTEVDISDPQHMSVVATQKVEGSFVDARQTGSNARLVFSSTPTAVYGGSTRLRSRVSGWIPASTLGKGRSTRGPRRRLAPCRSVRRSSAASGVDLLTVLTVDFARGLPAVDSDAVMTQADAVYASDKSLYVSTYNSGAGTGIHRFDISQPGVTEYKASGSVDGELLDRYSMWEWNGSLRVATTTTDNAGNHEQSAVTVLQDDAAGHLNRVGRVDGLGEGERIYAVRFIDDMGYVVTFKQVDPLHVIDLSNPAAPRLVGELGIRGYSAYLHPVGDHLLLGIGQDAGDTGRIQGTQLSLFDVSNPAAPSRLAQTLIGPESSSEVEYDAHAFLWWAPQSLAFVPIALGQQHGAYAAFNGGFGFNVTREGGIAEAGRLPAHAGSSAPIARSAVVGDRLFAMSSDGLVVSPLSPLAESGFVAFPGAGTGSTGGGGRPGTVTVPPLTEPGPVPRPVRR